jgi:hypothetical protein
LLQEGIGTSRKITPIGFPATLAEKLVTLDAIKQAGGNPPVGGTLTRWNGS